MAILIGPLNVAAQSPIPKAVKFLSKGKQENALKHLEKIFEKDSLDPEYYYSFSILHSIDSLPFYNIDTAYQHINHALLNFKSISDSKKIEGLYKDGIDLNSMVAQKTKIENAAFNRANAKNTEVDYNYFLNTFSENKWSDSVVVLRNKKAFEKALEENTYVGYRKFIETYPNANEIDKARYRFERLYFDESTSDEKLSSYVQFLVDHPKSHYRDLAEKRILELSTLTGNIKGFLSFLKNYPSSKLLGVARDFIYHIDSSQLPKTFWTDSLEEISKINASLLFPFYKFEKFGFNSNLGNEIIPPIFQNINGDYLCEVVNTDFLLIEKENQSQISNRLGTTIWKGNYKSVNDLGSGLLLIEHNNAFGVVHKSGIEILNNHFQEVLLLKNSLIAAKKNNFWGIYSLMGIPIFQHQYDEIESVSEFIVLIKDGISTIVTITQIETFSEGNDIDLTHQYNSYELLRSGDLLVRNSKYSNVISPKLKNRLPITTQNIHIEDNHLLAMEQGKFQLYSLDYKLMSNNLFTDYTYNTSSFFIKKDDRWINIDDQLQYDSAIILSNKVGLGLSVDSMTFYFDNAQFKKPIESIFRIIKDNSYQFDKQEYIVFTNKKGIEVYNLRSVQIFKGEVEKITALGPNLIVIQQKGKKRVIDAEGSVVTSMKMDAIGNFNNGSFSVLSKSKFGIYNTIDKTSIQPEYQRALKPYNARNLIAFKNGYYGLIDRKNTPITNFEFEEIRYWNDTSALVKLNFQWKIYNWNSKEYALEDIKDFSLLKNSDEEIIIKILVDNNYGIISSKRGVLVPSTYNDIIDIGTEIAPLYLAERNIEEAEFYVIIYYNLDGEIIYKQAYESEDYQKILCDLN